MKWNEKLAAVVIGFVLLATFTALLITHRIGAEQYPALVGITMAFSFLVAVLSRVQEFTLKLGEARIVLDSIDKVKAELAQMYGGIDHIKHATFILNNNTIEQLGLDPHHLPSSTGPMLYTAGVVKRERERLASIFIAEKAPKELAEALLDGSLDMLVFKHDGPEVPLNAPAKTAEQRRIERGSIF